MSQFHMEALLVSPAEMSLTGDLKAELDERSVVHRQVDSVEECISDADVIYMEPVVQADYTKAREEAAGDRPRTPAAYRVTPELDRLDGGRVPALEELRLHQGTVWTWNRAIYDPTAGGHLRVEMRALPAGPTVVDMLANAAFHLGLALALAPDAGAWARRLPFQQAHANFYRAAQLGMGASLSWPLDPGWRVRALPVAELARRLLPTAREGLQEAGVAGDEIDRLLAVIEARVTTAQTGAAWQRRTLAALEPRLGRERALAAMLERYLQHQEVGDPVHTWPVEAPG
jgi:hypothetical protein